MLEETREEKKLKYIQVQAHGKKLLLQLGLAQALHLFLIVTFSYGSSYLGFF